MSLAGPWAAWCAKVDDCKFAQATVARTVARWRLRVLDRAFKTWLAYIEMSQQERLGDEERASVRARRAKQLMQVDANLARRRQSLLICAAVACWRTRTRRRKAINVAADRAELRGQRAVLRGTLDALRSVSEQHQYQREVTQRALARWLLRLLACAFSTWRGELDASKAAEAALERVEMQERHVKLLACHDHASERLIVSHTLVARLHEQSAGAQALAHMLIRGLAHVESELQCAAEERRVLLHRHAELQAVCDKLERTNLKLQRFVRAHQHVLEIAGAFESSMSEELRRIPEVSPSPRKLPSSRGGREGHGSPDARQVHSQGAGPSLRHSREADTSSRTVRLSVEVSEVGTGTGGDDGTMQAHGGKGSASELAEGSTCELVDTRSAMTKRAAGEQGGSDSRMASEMARLAGMVRVFGRRNDGKENAERTQTWRNLLVSSRGGSQVELEDSDDDCLVV